MSWPCGSLLITLSLKLRKYRKYSARLCTTGIGCEDLHLQAFPSQLSYFLPAASRPQEAPVTFGLSSAITVLIEVSYWSKKQRCPLLQILYHYVIRILHFELFWSTVDLSFTCILHMQSFLYLSRGCQIALSSERSPLL